jgi:hypothetical protein
MRGQLLDKVSAVASGYLSVYIAMLGACFVVWCLGLLLCDWIEVRHKAKTGGDAPKLGGLRLSLYVHVSCSLGFVGGASALFLQAVSMVLVWLK